MQRRVSWPPACELSMLTLPSSAHARPFAPPEPLCSSPATVRRHTMTDAEDMQHAVRDLSAELGAALGDCQTKLVDGVVRGEHHELTRPAPLERRRPHRKAHGARL